MLIGGSDKALFAFHGVVSNFWQGVGNIFLCTSDMVKAFDKINHFALFHHMKKKGIPLCSVKIFANWFCKLRGRVKWRNGYSM